MLETELSLAASHRRVRRIAVLVQPVQHHRLIVFATAREASEAPAKQPSSSPWSLRAHAAFTTRVAQTSRW